MTNNTSYRPSFYLSINSLFVVFILIIGGLLAWHNYRDTKHIVIAEADKEYDQTLVRFFKNFQQIYKPVFDAVRLLSKTPVMKASTLYDRMKELGLLSAALQSKAEVAGLQVGYANGDYFISRWLIDGPLWYSLVTSKGKEVSRMQRRKSLCQSLIRRASQGTSHQFNTIKT